MPLINGCCCFEKLRDGSRATGIFSMCTSIIDVAIGLYAIIMIHGMQVTMYPHELENWLPPGVLVLLYLDFFTRIVMVFMSMSLLIGLNRRYDGKWFIWSWVYTVVAFRCFEFLIGTYTLTWLGGQRLSDIVFIHSYLLVIVFYWAICNIVLLFGVLAVVSYWQELYNEIWGLQKRAEKWTRLATTNMHGSTSTIGHLSHASLASRSHITYSTDGSSGKF